MPSSEKLERLQQSFDNSKSFLSLAAAEQSEIKKKYAESDDAEIAEAQKMMDQEAQVVHEISQEEQTLAEEKKAAVKELREAMVRVKKVELEMAETQDEQASNLHAAKLLKEVETVEVETKKVKSKFPLMRVVVVLALLAGTVAWILLHK